MENKPAGIAIVGCGAITKSQHLLTVLRSPNAKLAGLVDNQLAGFLCGFK